MYCFRFSARGCPAAVLRMWFSILNPPLEVCGVKAPEDDWSYLSDNNNMRLRFSLIFKTYFLNLFKEENINNNEMNVSRQFYSGSEGSWSERISSSVDRGDNGHRLPRSIPLQ